MSLLTQSKPVLTYFDLYGKAEAVRMALVHSKTDFEDNRVSGESWATFKASGKCMNGQIPVLEVAGGHCLNQSEAILRFVGVQTGAYNTADPLAMWAADSVISTANDFADRSPKGPEGKPMMYAMFGADAMKEEDVATLGAYRATMWAGMEKLLGDKNFFGGDKLNIGDFWMAAALFSWERNTQGKECQAHVYAAHAAALAGNAKMTAWADRIGEELKDHIATRGAGTL